MAGEPKASAADFRAWVDEMPGAEDTLHVKGEVTCPTLGWKASLTEASPQGPNPTIIILDLKLTKPTGEAGDIVTKVPATYQKKHGKKYKEVTIRQHGESPFTIKVKTTH